MVPIECSLLERFRCDCSTFQDRASENERMWVCKGGKRTAIGQLHIMLFFAEVQYPGPALLQAFLNHITG